MNLNLKNSIYRIGTLVLVFCAVVILFGLKPETSATIADITKFELLSLLLSSLALFVFTKVNFWQEIDQPETKRLAGMIFLAVHILVGLSVFSTYMVQFV